MSKMISLGHGKYAIVDDEDFDSLNQFRWYLKQRERVAYAQRGLYPESTTTAMMHREIMNAPNEMLVDHINHDGLDNRRVNLRLCNFGQSSRNVRRHKSKSTSRYKGVYYRSTSAQARACKKRRLWAAAICFDWNQIYIGCFHTEVEAARAYNEKAKELFGAFAYLNNILSEKA